MANKKIILSTRGLDPALLQQLQVAGLGTDAVAFIQIVYRNDAATMDAIKQCAAKEAIIIFTSRHAVEAVTTCLPFVPGWEIACIGGATRQAVASFFGEEKIILAAGTGNELAKKLQELKPVKPVIFFAGNLRMDAIPAGLQEAAIAIEEITVYETKLVPQVLQKEYDAVIFFSPSAVESFFIANKLKPDAVIFTIGETTAAAVRQKTNNKIVVSEKHDAAYLIRKLIDYYT